MKKLISFTVIGLCIAFTANTGCTTSGSGGGNVLSLLPNIANFALQTIASFVPGNGAGVTFSAPSLGAGTFTVNFNLTSSTTPADNLSNQSATFTMSAGATTGTFTTPAIPQGGNVSITINSISNSSGSSNVTSNNTKTFSDSTGLMTGTYTPAGGSAQQLRATHVIATITLNQLVINGTIWTPNLTGITLTDYIFAGTTGTVSFNANDLSSDANSTFNGTAAYNVAGSSGGIADLSQHGTITLTTLSPLITGTFTYTNTDSSVVAGSFSCPHP